MENSDKKRIGSYKDLDVYQDSYRLSLDIFYRILPKLPESERYDLRSQLSRSSKAIPRLIAEGHAKKHQKQGFQKYLDDAMAEANETIVSIEQIKDLYKIELELCEELVDGYDKIVRQLYNLAKAWDRYKNRAKSS